MKYLFTFAQPVLIHVPEEVAELPLVPCVHVDGVGDEVVPGPQGDVARLGRDVIDDVRGRRVLVVAALAALEKREGFFEVSLL